jgi:drug/metabolite transporter (DMT)-like permease
MIRVVVWFVGFLAFLGGVGCMFWALALLSENLPTPREPRHVNAGHLVGVGGLGLGLSLLAFTFSSLIHLRVNAANKPSTPTSSTPPPAT